MTFDQLPPERQKVLIDHMANEFGLPEAINGDWRTECQQMPAEDLAIHLDAAEFGYI